MKERANGLKSPTAAQLTKVHESGSVCDYLKMCARVFVLPLSQRVSSSCVYKWVQECSKLINGMRHANVRTLNWHYCGCQCLTLRACNCHASFLYKFTNKQQSLTSVI